MPFRSRSARAAVASGLIVLSGCYSYVPVGAGAHPTRGTQVRARLSRPENVALSDLTVSNVVLMDAEIVRSDADSLVVSAMSLRSATGGAFAAAGETVAVPASSVESLEERRMSAIRSTVLVVAAGTLAALLFRGFGTLDDGAGGGKPGPRPD